MTSPTENTVLTAWCHWRRFVETLEAEGIKLQASSFEVKEGETIKVECCLFAEIAPDE